jgi:hypothetical protein
MPAYSPDQIGDQELQDMYACLQVPLLVRSGGAARPTSTAGPGQPTPTSEAGQATPTGEPIQRIVIDDYVHSRVGRIVEHTLLFAVTATLIVLGTSIFLAFESP